LDETPSHIALGLDARSYGDFSKTNRVLTNLKDLGYELRIIFLDAGDEMLICRYKETRRQHPLFLKTKSIEESIQDERELLLKLKSMSNHIIDTSYMQLKGLKQSISAALKDDDIQTNFFITVLSFGYKYGIPKDADIIFDVRFLPNPYYVEELRPKTGLDQDVQDYVLNNETTSIFMEKLKDMMFFLIPNYIKEGKSQLVIGIGCTGGKHRSVTLATKLYDSLDNSGQYSKYLNHRDIKR
ncbi:MAG TPA: RNase adapter RapZ, partial [Candidatus Dorea intestinavium]|nr:RNase adapter RapZ [Candidatus Dorea intestinavium]